MTDLLFQSAESGGGGEGVADAYVDGSSRVVQLISPVGIAEPLIRAVFRARHISATNQDLQFEVASDAAFATVISSATITNVAPLVTTSWTMGVDLTPGVKAYWRVRAGDFSGSSWGSWYSSFTMYQTGGNGYGYVWLNASAVVTDTGKGHEYAWLNGGPLLVDVGCGYEWVWANVGRDLQIGTDAYEYVWQNNDDSNPLPHVWFVDPTSGRPGDGFTVIGFGFGDLQSTYTGHVEIDLQDGAGWQTVGVVTWQRFPADPDMYGPDREIRAGKIDPQHDEIGVLVPSAAIPPGLLVRVVLNP